mgnify:CR=1 FL=1
MTPPLSLFHLLIPPSSQHQYWKVWESYHVPVQQPLLAQRVVNQIATLQSQNLAFNT